MLRIAPALAVLAAVTLSLAPATASRTTGSCGSADRDWDGGGDALSWHDPLNWDPNGLPQPGEDVCIDVAGDADVLLSEGTQSIASLESLESLFITGGTLELTDTTRDSSIFRLSLSLQGSLLGAGTVTLLDESFWYGGTMSGTGTTIVDSGGTLLILAPVRHVELRGGRTVRVNGELHWAQGNIRSGEGAVIETAGGGLFAVTSVESWTHELGGARPRLHVFPGGNVAKATELEAATIAAELDNDGSVFSGAGALVFTGGDGAASSTGTFGGGSGGIVALTAGSFDLATGAAFTGRVGIEGSAVVNVGGTVASTTNGSLRLADSAVLYGSGTLTLRGNSVWTGGHMGGGTTVIAPEGSLTMDASGGGFMHLHAHTLRIEGSATWQGGGIRSGQSALLDVLGTFTIASDGLFDFIYGETQARLHVAPGGSLTKTASSGTTAINAIVDNDGTVGVETGTLRPTWLQNWNGATRTFSRGTWNLRGVLRFPGADLLTNAAALFLDGTASAIVDDTSGQNGLRNLATNTAAGSLTIDGGRHLAVSGGFANAGTLSVGQASTFVVAQPLTNTGLLGGAGMVEAFVTSSGEVAPGAPQGVLTIFNYVQTSSGRLRVEIAGDTEHDRLRIFRDATLDGTLTIETASGCRPPPGAVFDVLTGDRTRSGQFAAVEGVDLGGGRVYVTQYEPTAVRLRVAQLRLLWPGPGRS